MTVNRPDRVIELHGGRVEVDDAAPEPVEVPYTMLSPEALRGVLESVVLREGTDYGERERTLEQKVAELLERLRRREARLVFDSRSQTVDIHSMSRDPKGKE
jgi:uncharacterized protein